MLAMVLIYRVSLKCLKGMSNCIIVTMHAVRFIFQYSGVHTSVVMANDILIGVALGSPFFISYFSSFVFQKVLLWEQELTL